MYKIDRWGEAQKSYTRTDPAAPCPLADLAAALGPLACPSHMTNYIHVLHIRSMYKIDGSGGGGGQK